MPVPSPFTRTSATDEIVRLDALVAQKDAEIVNLQTANAALNASVTTLNDTLADQLATIANLETANGELVTQVDNLVGSQAALAAFRDKAQEWFNTFPLVGVVLP